MLLVKESSILIRGRIRWVQCCDSKLLSCRKKTCVQSHCFTTVRKSCWNIVSPVQEFLDGWHQTSAVYETLAIEVLKYWYDIGLDQLTV